eukprot:gnl/MRDRNA2_/MRDRNA2_38159_c0_seq1.p1 gnl/MRDRNA2_/MRDRNA2_38159_c0~~gnl/MRDRNA2_/MRDRNA2_38159_c0_seq1.p1  ORF type:complete len:452 (+),score=91.26 gnl/MRDRNA2_/MRDRNA2_38159_c0_seq1:112-1356(+)
MPARDFGDSYPARRAASPVRGPARMRSPSPVTPASDLGGSHPAGYDESSFPVPAWRQLNHGTTSDGSFRFSPKSEQSLWQQVQQPGDSAAPLSIAEQSDPMVSGADHPLLIKECPNRWSSYLNMAQKVLADANERVAADDPFAVNQVEVAKVKESFPTFQELPPCAPKVEEPPMRKVQDDPVKQNLQNIPGEQISNGNGFQESNRVTENRLRSRLQEVERENALLKSKVSDSQIQASKLEQQQKKLEQQVETLRREYKHERLQASKNLQDSRERQECIFFQKQCAESQGKLNHLVVECDALRERKDNAEYMLHAAMERWEADQQRLIAAERRLKELIEQPPGMGNIVLGGKREDPSQEPWRATNPGRAEGQGLNVHGVAGLWLCRALNRISKKSLAAGFAAIEARSSAPKSRST